MTSENMNLTPPDVLDKANEVSLSLLPEKSRDRYEKVYMEFLAWCRQKHVIVCSESVLLAYFAEIAERGLIGSLWPIYSILKTTLNIKENTDITGFHKLVMFIKRKKEGYTPKKSKVLEKHHVQKFISDAPDNLFLMNKIVLIFGVAGALRKIELINLETDDVQDLDTKFLITIKFSKTKTSRVFTIIDDEKKNILKLIRNYIKLRPAHISHKRFFIFYKNNKCTRNPVGINTFGKIPSIIATFLKLDEPHLYTGHCFRRSSASILSDEGADFAAIKRHGGWKSTSVAEGYIDNSLQNKIKIAQHLLTSDPMTLETTSTSTIQIDNPQPSSSFHEDIHLNLNQESLSATSTPNLNFQNCQIQNITINITKSTT